MRAAAHWQGAWLPRWCLTCLVVSWGAGRQVGLPGEAQKKQACRSPGFRALESQVLTHAAETPTLLSSASHWTPNPANPKADAASRPGLFPFLPLTPVVLKARAHLRVLWVTRSLACAPLSTPLSFLGSGPGTLACVLERRPAPSLSGPSPLLPLLVSEASVRVTCMSLVREFPESRAGGLGR